LDAIAVERVVITRPDALLDHLAKGVSAPHFLGRSAEKIVLARRQKRDTRNRRLNK